VGTVQRFTYFDCTDSIDDNDRGIVSNATAGKSANLSTLGHLRMLLGYIVCMRPDVHSGYFVKGFVGSLIYRFACIGYHGNEVAYKNFDEFNDACKKHQVKALCK
jgi:hypothetical protein